MRRLRKCVRSSGARLPRGASDTLRALFDLGQTVYPSAGLGPVCASSPDGGAFFYIGSDNYVLTADRWRFTQANGGAPPPADEHGTQSKHGPTFVGVAAAAIGDSAPPLR